MNSFIHKKDVYPMVKDGIGSCILEANVSQRRKRDSGSLEPTIFSTKCCKSPNIAEISKINKSMEVEGIPILRDVRVVIKKLKTHEIPNVNNNDVVSVINETLEVAGSPNIGEVSVINESMEIKEFPILKDAYVVIKKLKAHEIPSVDYADVSLSGKAIEIPIRTMPCCIVLEDIKNKLSTEKYLNYFIPTKKSINNQNKVLKLKRKKKSEEKKR